MPYKDKEKAKERDKRYALENREKLREYHKQYNIDNAEKKRQYRKDNAERSRKYDKQYRIDNLEKVKGYYKTEEYRKRKKKYYLMRDYNITMDDYNKMVAKQNGNCDICGKHQDELKIFLTVDHSHETGKIRGLLCTRCNLVIGCAKDDISILKNAIKYLKRNE